MTTFGSAYQPALDFARIATQRDKVKQVLLLAARYNTWMTLAELARKTAFPEASISAQLRHLRKERFGAYNVTKRRRTTGTWEYRIEETCQS